MPLAESLRVDSEDEEGLFDSLGVFLSSPGKGKQGRSVIWEMMAGEEEEEVSAVPGSVSTVCSPRAPAGWEPGSREGLARTQNTCSVAVASPDACGPLLRS